jgi:hypothetical protein
MGFVSDVVDALVHAPREEFADVAAQGPVEAFLVAMGAVLVGAPLLVLGVLVAGAAAELVVPDAIEERHP